MFMTCLDLEGVLTPELWELTADLTGVNELRLTTREEPDYDKLMRYRLDVMRKNHITIYDMQEAISKSQPLPGAVEFLNELRKFTQVIIVSDCFWRICQPLIRQLGNPTIFCHELVVDDGGNVKDYKLRVNEDTKLVTVRALQGIGFDTIASGDSYNDLDMIRASYDGYLFRTTDQIRKENPDIAAYETYDELLQAIRRSMGLLPAGR